MVLDASLSFIRSRHCGQLVYMGNWMETLEYLAFTALDILSSCSWAANVSTQTQTAATTLTGLTGSNLYLSIFRWSLKTHVEFRNHHLSVTLQIFKIFIEPLLWMGGSVWIVGFIRSKHCTLSITVTGCMIYHNRVMGQERQTTNYRRDQIWCDDCAQTLLHIHQKCHRDIA